MDLFPEHPGIELRNIIKQKDMNISEFARMIEVSPSRINEIVHTKRSITLDTAMRLAKALNTTTKYWMEKQVDYDILRQSPYDMNIIDNIVEVMVNVYASQKECINISGDMIPLNEVINRLKRINLTHIQYVMECIGKSIKSIRRPNNYLLTALYNAPVTTDLYYAMQVKHDLHNYPDG